MKNCKECTHPGRECIPYLMTLSPSDTLDWCKMRKETLRLSYDEIADRTNVPKSTISRIFSDKQTDCRFTTMQPVVCLLSGCEQADLDCEAANRLPNEALIEQMKVKDELIRHLEEETKILNEHIDRAKKEEAESLAYMKKKEKGHVRTIVILSILLGITLLLIIAALVVDRFNPNIGFFWLTSWLGGGKESIYTIARSIT